ncbi:hypothetical protein EVAR_93863_1 [Eumeta japonica]|uniref:Uncharacterized protein n=1 Tax=Eumeta variegata TaxID=151549 RepID=A0A4C1TX01_EUMVA|nr:hypothetical protein EVAR_93863_1 [Eumeta japonica]
MEKTMILLEVMLHFYLFIIMNEIGHKLKRRRLTAKYSAEGGSCARLVVPVRSRSECTIVRQCLRRLQRNTAAELPFGKIPAVKKL